MGSVADVETYFTDVLSDKQGNANLLAESLRQYVPSAADHETTNDLYADLSSTEVAAKLRSAANTCPGADREEYAHLKRIDPSAKIVTLIADPVSSCA